MVEEKQEIKLMPYAENYNGKHDGWAYQLLNDNFEGFYPGVCCKDYLLDQVWSDLTKQSMEAFDQKSDYKGIIDHQDTLKLVIYPYLFKGVKEPVIENLEELSINLQSFLNEIELLRDFELSSVETVENRLLIIFSKEWIKKPYLLSLFTLLCRLGIYYDGNLDSYLENPIKEDRPYLDNSDSYYLKSNIKAILAIVYNNAEIEQKDWIELEGGDEVHDSGLFYNINKLKYKNGTS